MLEVSAKCSLVSGFIWLTFFFFCQFWAGRKIPESSPFLRTARSVRVAEVEVAREDLESVCRRSKSW